MRREVGIVSFGGYIPRYRLSRSAIYSGMGWYIPALIMVAQGERSFGNWDEDSLTMAVEAARNCIVGLNSPPREEIDAFYLASTTLPYASRQNSSIASTALNLREDVTTADFSSSMRAGTTALLAALDSVLSGRSRYSLVSASDQRQAKIASFYEMWYGDGAASLLVGPAKDSVAVLVESFSLSLDFVDHYRASDRKFPYTWEERWVRDAGYAEIIPRAIRGVLDKAGLKIEEIDHFVYPCFIKSEHRKIAKKLGLSRDKVQDNLHEVCGETGTAHPLLMLNAVLERAQPGEKILMTSFGQGADAFIFEVTEKLKELPKRRAFRDLAEDKEVVDNYFKFLQFRGMLESETGIRAEANMQTALSTLWRNRKMILGLVGGICKKCGTPQYPRPQICVNPECRAVDSMDDYPFADRKAKIVSFTGDMLAVTQEPPAIYGMIEFEGGGRFIADFTDCKLEELKVGRPLRMVFRKKYYDKERGFTGYFWKATPAERATESAEEAEKIRFDGQVAIVTGAGRGLGRVYAIELAKRGARVVVNDLGGGKDGSGADTSPADSVVEEIRAFGGQAVANYDSVADEEGAKRIVQTALEHFGRVDILINNAGILRDKSLAKMTDEQWRAVISVHLDGAFYVTREAFKQMREQGYGRIIFATSASGLYGNFGQTNYSAAKMGLVGFMNSLKLEGEKYNVKVNAVAPIAYSRLTEDLLPEEMAQRLAPEYVAPLVLYLSSSECPISGGIFNAGGGYFNRAAVVTAPHVQVKGDGDSPPSPELLAEYWELIDRIQPHTEYSSAVEFISEFTSPPPPLSFEETSPQSEQASESPEPTEGIASQVREVFRQLPQRFLPEKAGGKEVTFQFKLSGQGGGEWFVEVKDNTCSVSEGVHPNPTVTLELSAGDFVKFVRRELDPMKAYTSGKLKVSGDIIKSQLITKIFKF